MTTIMALKTVEWAQVAGPVFAAVAALASWAAVRQSRRALDIAQLPQLNGYWLAQDDGSVVLKIDNTGSGNARLPSFSVVSAGTRAAGTVQTLSPGAHVRLATELPAQARDTAVTGVLFCLDWAGRWHVWSWDGRHEQARRRTRSPKLPGPDEALRRMYPQVAGRTLEEVSWKTEAVQEVAR